MAQGTRESGLRTGRAAKENSGMQMEIHVDHFWGVGISMADEGEWKDDKAHGYGIYIH